MEKFGGRDGTDGRTGGKATGTNNTLQPSFGRVDGGGGGGRRQEGGGGGGGGGGGRGGGRGGGGVNRKDLTPTARDPATPPRPSDTPVAKDETSSGMGRRGA